MSGAPAAPRPAATIVVARDAARGAGHAGAAFEVFLVRRHQRSGFMANAYVFPGGRVDAADASPEAVARLAGLDAAALCDRMHGIGDAAEASAHVVAAIRETFEEAGVLLASRRGKGATSPAPAAFDAWRRRLDAREATIVDLLEAEDLELAGGELRYFGHWITPLIERRRFDARFFIARVPPDARAEHDGRETTDSLWIRPAEAVARHAEGDLWLAPPQWHILRALAELDDVASALAWADGRGRVAPIMPHAETVEGRFVLALPGDPLHPFSPRSSANRRIVLRDGRWCDA